MAKNLSWMELVRRARARVAELSEDEQVQIAQRNSMLNAHVMQTLQHLQREINLGLKIKGVKVWMEFPETLDTKLRGRFLAHLNRFLSDPFYAEPALQAQKIGYYVTWAVTPAA